MLIYFSFTNSFYAFINYCIGGLLDFGANNTVISFSLEWIEIIFFIILGKVILMDNENEKKLMILIVFQLCMFTLIYPNSNIYHMNLVKLALLPLFMGVINHVKDEKKIPMYILIFLFFMSFVSGVLFKSDMSSSFTPFQELFTGEDLYAGIFTSCGVYICFIALVILMLFEKEKLAEYITVIWMIFLLIGQWSLNIALKNNESISGKLQIYAGINCGVEKLEYIEDVMNYIFEIEKEGKRVLVVSVDASYYMAPINRNNYIYDFALYGCLGYKGEESLIENLKLDEDTIILKNEYMFYQESELLDEYIKENCEKIDKIRDLEVYKKI